VTRGEYELTHQRIWGRKVDLVDLIESAVDASLADPGQRPHRRRWVLTSGFESESLLLVRRWQQGFPTEHV
jgi:hypothetical protein